jgi:glutamate racemase
MPLHIMPPLLAPLPVARLRSDGRPWIGVFDSGVGGLSVAREVRTHLPGVPMLYYADQAHVPYGGRPYDEINGFTHAIADALITAGASAVVVACHSACAAGLADLRAAWPHVPFIGVEPAVKPAAAATRTGVVGAVMTQATADGALYRRVCAEHARGVRVLTAVAPEWVALVEAGVWEGEGADRAVGRVLAPLLAEGIDQLVLACTHYPFLAPTIARTAGPGVALVDPAPGIARQVGRVLAARGLLSDRPSPAPFAAVTSGDAAVLNTLAVRAGLPETGA